MFTLAEGGEWLRRARVTPSPDAGLGLLSDLQRAHLLFVTDNSGADLATVEPGKSGSFPKHYMSIPGRHAVRPAAARTLFLLRTAPAPTSPPWSQVGSTLFPNSGHLSCLGNRRQHSWRGADGGRAVKILRLPLVTNNSGADLATVEPGKSGSTY